MRSLLLIAAVLVAGALSLEAGQRCEPGSTFKMDCNTCRCSADGMVVSCTRKFCLPELQGDDPKVQEPSGNAQSEAAAVEKEEEEVHTNGQVCTPNEVKMEDCNRCKCAANGIGWFCTRKACPPRERRAVQPKMECEPGTTFRSDDDCNSCFCTETGIAACTQKACINFSSLKPKRAIAAQPPKQDCVPGTSFKSADGCNDCFCTDTGIAACTMKFCFNTKTKRDTAMQPPKKDCVPGTSFKSADGCNDCFCTETGIAACTMKFCFNTRTKRDTPPEENCVPGTTYKHADGCNDCTCIQPGKAICTIKLCPETSLRAKRLAAKSMEKQCEPGTSFKHSDGCNDCFCSDNGMAACTLKFCFFEEPTTKSKRQVNNDELPVSELAPGTPGFTCNPGKSFKYQCNTCRCDTTGQTAACTFKFCIPGEY
ncbi:kielin/chordin-like protein [Aedes albopictus]|uniref:Pacifastin domain-containing protein n=1 Tax=Aedes albopictus TaxID=7160 RepID=A0ABM1Z7K9_AEDAL|nr:kielin/chordin-like protein [Aedes albopictus]